MTDTYLTVVSPLHLLFYLHVPCKVFRGAEQLLSWRVLMVSACNCWILLVWSILAKHDPLSRTLACMQKWGWTAARGDVLSHTPTYPSLLVSEIKESCSAGPQQAIIWFIINVSLALQGHSRQVRVQQLQRGSQDTLGKRLLCSHGGNEFAWLFVCFLDLPTVKAVANLWLILFLACCFFPMTVSLSNRDLRTYSHC